MHSEWTPAQFTGERQEPNVIEWFRFEQWGKGTSSRLFYNEAPKPNWFRHGGHFDEPEKIFSFTKAEQDSKFMFGVDTTTAEGREVFKREWDTMATLVPELLSKEDLVFPHEIQKISTEPYYRRMWQHYREHTFKLRLALLVDQNHITRDEAEAVRRFLSLKGGAPSLTTYLYARLGRLPDIEQNADYQVTQKVFEKLGLNHINVDNLTAQPYEEQFWDQYDILQQLTDEEFRQDLPLMVTDPSNRAKVEALLDDRKVLPSEETQRLEAHF